MLTLLVAEAAAEWSAMVEILLLLVFALTLGTLAEQFRQSAILGYLVAGTLVGPHVLGLVKSEQHVNVIAEIGVAMLLFTVGLEFSLTRLRKLGGVALVGGTLQVVITVAAGFALTAIFGVGAKTAICLGAMMALSSTACVIRLLQDSAALDTRYGRGAVGVLLLQDIAVVPLMVIVTALSGTGGVGDIVWATSKTVGFGVLMVLGFYIAINYIVPHILNIQRWVKNRELPILFAVVLALGAAATAHHLGLSPAIGAFIAGMLLAESPFANQVRADVGSLRTVLVTLFFASIGMLAEPVWVMHNAHLVLGAAAGILILKPAIIWGIMRRFGYTHGQALATGMCLAQVGEFTFVLAEVARGTAINEDTFRLIVATTIVTLFATPFLVRLAPTVGARLNAWLDRPKAKKPGAAPDTPPVSEDDEDAMHPSEPPIAIIGFGPAGQAVALALIEQEHRDRLIIIDLNRRNADTARRMGLRVQVGSGAAVEVLEHAHVNQASVVVVTVPDPTTARNVIHACRSLNPDVQLIVRSRYHVYRWELLLTGAAAVVDEEEQVGHELARETLKLLPDD